MRDAGKKDATMPRATTGSDSMLAHWSFRLGILLHRHGVTKNMSEAQRVLQELIAVPQHQGRKSKSFFAGLPTS
jgi:hypothetical protein